MGRANAGVDLDRLFQDNVVGNGPALLSYFLRRIAVREDAADLVSEVYLTAWRRASEIPMDPEASKRWLYSLSRGAVANYRRGELRRHDLSDRLRSALREADQSSETPPADAEDVLAVLSEPDRELLRLIHWEGLALHEAAQVLQIRPATARKRAERARTRLASSRRIGRSPAGTPPGLPIIV